MVGRNVLAISILIIFLYLKIELFLKIKFVWFPFVSDLNSQKDHLMVSKKITS